MDSLAICFERESSESFCQVVRVLFLRQAFDDRQPSLRVPFRVIDIRPEKVQLGIKVSASRRETLVRC